jgi:hypothetical protein
MAWTAPTTRSTGLLVTASIWNTDIVNNLLYLKASPTFDGNVTVSGTLTVSTGGGNVALLNAANTFALTQTFSTTALIDGNYLRVDSLGFAGRSSVISTLGAATDTDFYATNNLFLVASGAHAISFATNGAKRWGINAAGDFTFGASSHIADSSGTPTITSGFGTSPTIAGADYAFVVALGTTPGVSGTVGFGHTFSTAPVCVLSSDAGSTPFISTISTTQIAIVGLSGLAAGTKLWVHCRGY